MKREALLGGTFFDITRLYCVLEYKHLICTTKYVLTSTVGKLAPLEDGAIFLSLLLYSPCFASACFTVQVLPHFVRLAGMHAISFLLPYVQLQLQLVF